MAQQIVNNGDTGLVARNKINENFTEVYAGRDLIVLETASNFVVTNQDICANTGTSLITATLPLLADFDKEVTFNPGPAVGGGSILILPSGGETINGGGSALTATPGQTYTIFPFTAEWQIV